MFESARMIFPSRVWRWVTGIFRDNIFIYFLPNKKFPWCKVLMWVRLLQVNAGQSREHKRKLSTTKLCPSVFPLKMYTQMKKHSMSECFHLMHFEHEWIDMPSTAWQYGLMLEIQLPNYRKINSIFVFGPENFHKPWKIFWVSTNLIIPYSKEGFVFDVPNEQWPCLN